MASSRPFFQEIQQDLILKYDSSKVSVREHPMDFLEQVRNWRYHFLQFRSLMPKTQWAWSDCFSTFDFPMNKDEIGGRKLLSRFVSSTSRLGSYNWPNMYPIMASQPSSQLNEETVLFYMNALQTRSGEYHRPTVVLVEMRHWHHCEKFYFVLDGHHKLEAMQRLSSMARCA